MGEAPCSSAGALCSAGWQKQGLSWEYSMLQYGHSMISLRRREIQRMQATEGIVGAPAGKREIDNFDGDNQQKQ